MRSRDRVLQSLEKLYRGAFTAAEDAGETETMAKLDLDFQRDQLQLEVLLDIRDLQTPGGGEEDKTTSLLEKAQQIRKLTHLR